MHFEPKNESCTSTNVWQCTWCSCLVTFKFTGWLWSNKRIVRSFEMTLGAPTNACKQVTSNLTYTRNQWYKKVQSSDWSKWRCVLSRYVISRDFQDLIVFVYPFATVDVRCIPTFVVASGVISSAVTVRQWEETPISMCMTSYKKEVGDFFCKQIHRTVSEINYNAHVSMVADENLKCLSWRHFSEWHHSTLTSTLTSSVLHGSLSRHYRDCTCLKHQSRLSSIGSLLIKSPVTGSVTQWKLSLLLWLHSS